MKEKQAVNFELQSSCRCPIKLGFRNELEFRIRELGKLIWIYVSKDIIDQNAEYTTPNNNTKDRIYVFSSDSEKIILKTTENDKEDIILKKVEAVGELTWYEITSFLMFDFIGNEIKYEKPANPSQILFIANKFDNGYL